mmetsp:Transcript_12662/g.30803  ORF Transcript_12662/g.30803 Transcript_12662/m.30803 type:complete len:267 (-) Transcript_12662:538-1338(-)
MYFGLRVEPPPVLDDVGNVHHEDVVLLREGSRVAVSQHLPVVVHQLRQSPHRVLHVRGEAAKIKGRLRVPLSRVHTFRVRAERKHVSGLGKHLRAVLDVAKRTDRGHAVLRAHARGDPSAQIVRAHVKVSSVRVRVLPGRRVQPKTLEPLLAGGHAHNPRGLADHEGHLRRRAVFRRYDEVAFVLSVGRVHHQHELSLTKLLQRLLHAENRRRQWERWFFRDLLRFRCRFRCCQSFGLSSAARRGRKAVRRILAGNHDSHFSRLKC